MELISGKIDSFAHLPIGWRYGEGGPISEPVRKAALLFHRRAANLGFTETDVAPGASGAIAFAIVFKGHFLEFVIQPDLSVDFWHDVNGEEVTSVEGLTLDQALTRLLEFANRRWNSSDSSTRTTSTQDLTDSQARHLKIRLMGLESPLSGGNVWLALDTPSANISRVTIRQLLETPQSFGDSEPSFSLRVAA
jgi:hypothetical protein